ncbi:hypothetical protein ACFYP4_02230 [Streptomyces sp. NPDC005551]|uniref:hypothetical protein n=1 Tax=Streptomyces sp. NPDC005551 TaxID=3364725 RepID=UPI0036764D03
MKPKMHVLSTGDGPLGVGSLDELKKHAEKLLTSIVGATKFKWERVENSEDDEPKERLALHRWMATRWGNVQYYIDEVPVLGGTKKGEGNG